VYYSHGGRHRQKRVLGGEGRGEGEEDKNVLIDESESRKILSAYSNVDDSKPRRNLDLILEVQSASLGVGHGNSVYRIESLTFVRHMYIPHAHLGRLLLTATKGRRAPLMEYSASKKKRKISKLLH
jgi:hypothetical protein